MTEIVCAVDAKAELGEGTFWDPVAEVLWWVDIWGKAIHRFDPATGTDERFATPDYVGSLAPRSQGGLVVALAKGFHFFDPATGIFEKIVEPADRHPQTRFNDGKTDARGRFIAGTLDSKFKESVGSIFSLDGSLKCTTLEPAIGCTNGPCFSPDNRTFYCADSVSRTISAYDYDLATGTVSNKRLFAAIKGLGGVPDGATVDAEGHLWSAIAGGGKIVCYKPDGSISRTVEVPVPIITSVMFGGDNLDVMYATSIGEKILGMEPGAEGGSLFAIQGLDVKGKPEPRFAG